MLMICENAEKCQRSECEEKIKHEYNSKKCIIECDGLLKGTIQGSKCVEVKDNNMIEEPKEGDEVEVFSDKECTKSEGIRTFIYKDKNGFVICVVGNGNGIDFYKTKSHYTTHVWQYWKPIKKPELVPFDFSDNLVGKTLEKNNEKYLILHQNNNGIHIIDTTLNTILHYYIYRYIDLLNSDFTIDGKPCGKGK